MKKMQIVLKSLLILCVPIALLWGMFLFLGNQLTMTDINEVYNLPEQTELVVELNLKNIDSRLIDEVLVGGEGDYLIKYLKEHIQSSKFEKEFGINWFRPVTYFQTQFGDGTLQGLIVYISDKNSWNKNINTFLGNTSIARSVGQVGIVVQSKQLNKHELNRFVELCKTETNESKEDLKSLVRIKQNVTGFESEFICDASQDMIRLNGVSKLSNLDNFTSLNYVLEPAAFHFTTEFVPDSTYAELNQFLPITSVEGVKVVALSCNYRGLTIDNSSGELILLPNADVILKFNRKLVADDIKQIFASANVTTDQITIGKKVFYYKLLLNDVLYVGESKFENAGVVENNQRIGIRISGAPAHLTNLEGNSFVKAAISMSSNINSLFQLLRSMKDIQMTTQVVSDSRMNVDLKFNFKASKNPLLTVIEGVLINFL